MSACLIFTSLRRFLQRLDFSQFKGLSGEAGCFNWGRESVQNNLITTNLSLLSPASSMMDLYKKLNLSRTMRSRSAGAEVLGCQTFNIQFICSLLYIICVTCVNVARTRFLVRDGNFRIKMSCLVTPNWTLIEHPNIREILLFRVTDSCFCCCCVCGS